jgi:hypothetical protein
MDKTNNAQASQHTICHRNGCRAPASTLRPYCDNCIRHIKFRHMAGCNCDELYFRGPVAICVKCNQNSSDLNLCSCVHTDDPTPLIRSHSGFTFMELCIPANRRHRNGTTLHYITDDWVATYPHARSYICPRKRNYTDCIAAVASADCEKIVTTVNQRIPICNSCIKTNECRHCKHGWVHNTDSPANVTMKACSNHRVYNCITCSKQHVDDWRIQCAECDRMTNTIVCCDVVHRPHTLSYPRRNVSDPYCILHNQYLFIPHPAGYWYCIQTNLIQQLYKTVAASPERRRMPFATALMLRLTWQRGNHANMSTCAIEEYILSQHDCAASALMRVRWLPQVLRLMIIGYV